MSSTVSVRDLRNHGGEVLTRVQAGETVTVTSAGMPVAELRPLPAPYLSTRQLIDQRRGWQPVDPRRLQSDVDSILDQTI